MVPAKLPPLLWCGLWALPAAIVGAASFAAGAFVAAAGVVWAVAGPGRSRFAGLAALPVFLAAAAAPPPLAAMPPPGPVVVAGTVSGVVRAPELGTVLLTVGDRRRAVRIVLGSDLEVLPGDRVRALAFAAIPPIPGQAPSLHAEPANVHVQVGPASLARAAAAARRALERQLLHHVPGDAGALLAALVLGRDTRPASAVQAAHRATGLSHLLAVSGAHAAMLAFLLGLSGWHGRRRLRHGHRHTIAVLGLLATYAAITGNEPPVLRAVVAYAIAALAAQLGRAAGVVPLLVGPAVATAFVQPHALLGPSFLLSYAAVAGLFLAGPPRGETFFARWIAAPLRASLWATLLTAPLTLWFFGQLAPWTVLLTPLLTPWVGAMLLGGLALALAGLVAPPLAAALAWPLAALADLYARCVTWADALPGTPLAAWVAPPAWAFALGACAALLLLAWRPSRAGAAGAVLLLVAPHYLPLPRVRGDTLQLFAVGHGQSCLLRSGTHTTAIDCGSLHAPFLAASCLVDALPDRTLDLLVVTHADSDHHGGVPMLLARVRVHEAVLPVALTAHPLAAALREHGAAITLLAPGERAAPAPHLSVQAPPLPPGASDNDQSLWVSATVAGVRVLLPGDAQELGVATALAAGVATQHDVLVLPHHGRPNHNAPRLLQRVRPRFCLASASAADGETALGPLVRGNGAELWTTGLDGSLRLEGVPPRVRGDFPGRAVPHPRSGAEPGAVDRTR